MQKPGFSEQIFNSINENYTEIILIGIAIMAVVTIFNIALFFIFSKIKKPVSVATPLVISMITGLIFTAGFSCSVVMPFFMSERKWSHFLSIILISSYFVFFILSFVVSYLFGSRELKRYEDIISEDGIVLGVRNMPDGSAAINPKWFKMGWQSLFTNILVLGGIGSGKTSTVLLKFLQQICNMNKSRPSCFVLDIKGDLFETVKLWNHSRQDDLVCYGYGYVPTNMLGSDDVLKTVDNLSKSFECLNEKGSSDVFYSGVQKDYLKMIIHLYRLFFSRPLTDEANRYIYNRYFMFKDDMSEHMWRLFQLGTSVQVRSFKNTPPYKRQLIPFESYEYDKIFLNEKDAFVRADDFTIKDIYIILNDVRLSKTLYMYMREYLFYLKIVKHHWDKYNDMESTLDLYRIFVFDKSFEKNITGVKAPLSTISDKSISDYFNARNRTIDFKKDIDAGKIIFINVPEGNLGKDVARLIGILFLFQYLSALNTRNSVIGGMDRERPVFILIDEFFKFINSELMNFTSTSRSARVCNVLLGQSLGQIPPEYKDATKSNLRTKIIFSIGDEVTAEEISRYLGEHKTVRKSTSKSYGITQSQSKSESELFDRKIKPQDLIEMAPWKAAVSHFDGSQTLPAEIVSFPAWFHKGFNIYPVEHVFISFYNKIKVQEEELDKKGNKSIVTKIKRKPVPVTKDSAKTFLLKIKKFCSGNRIKISEITVSDSNIYFALSYRSSFLQTSRNLIENAASKIHPSFDLTVKQYSYDELISQKKKLNLPESNVRI